MKKNVTRAYVILFFIFAVSGKHIFPSDTEPSKIKHLEAAFSKIDQAYPKSRYFRSGASLISGFFRCKTARDILNDENPRKFEKFAAYSLLGFSSVRYFDGIKGLFFKSAIEKSLLNFQELNHQQKIKYGERILKKVAESGKRDRLFHSYLRAASGGLYLYLYFKDKDKHKSNLFSGLIYVGVAAINLFSRSTPEKAWKSYKNKNFKQGNSRGMPNTQFYISPEYNGFRTGFLMTF